MLYNLKEELEKIYSKDEIQKIKMYFKEDKKACIFLNKIKCQNKELEKILTEKDIEFKQIDEYCYKINDKNKASKSSAFTKGLFYIQNFSSYLCAKNLNVSKDDIVLDMCAAPGGKSINLANFMANDGKLSCMELNRNRFFKLEANLKKYGVKNAKIFQKNALLIGKLKPLSFDKILLDAPCSAFSKLGFDFKKNKKEIKSLAKLQKKLLNSALNALKIGGELVYSTCTLSKEENEEVIQNALNSKFKLELLELDLAGLENKDSQGLSKAKRIIPDENSQAFFICKLKKLS